MSAGAITQPRVLPMDLPGRKTRSERIWRLIRRRPVDAIGAVFVLFTIFTAIFADAMAPTGYAEQDFASRLMAPSAAHWFGTDSLGRDVLSRIIYGARTSMVASTIAVVVSGVLGGVLGVTSGFFGGRFDLVVQRICDSFDTVPLLLMAMLLIVAFGGSLINVALALGLVGSMRVNRVARGSTLSVINTPYLEAAVSLGATSNRLMWRHILPNVMAALIVTLSIQFGGFIIAEAGLSFLGLGVPPPYPSWGGMLSADGRAHFLRAPWLAIAPGIVISVTVLATNLVGDAMRDILDPRQRGA
ncbi:MAG: ABC transporter permease [Dehalococcoidia bacterium]|nr:ABC transporter permease [Dehalococcoidia bacterium]